MVCVGVGAHAPLKLCRAAHVLGRSGLVQERQGWGCFGAVCLNLLKPRRSVPVSSVQCWAGPRTLGALGEVGASDFTRAATSRSTAFFQQAWRQGTHCTTSLDSVNLAAG